MKRLTFVIACVLGASGCQVDPYCLSCRDPEAGIDGGPDTMSDSGDGRPDGRVDGQVPDAGPDACVAEICNERDDDCDGVVDNGFVLDSNPEHCGECGNFCLPPHAFAMCISGECALGDCDFEFYDLNGNPDDGCEYRCAGTATDDSVCNLRDDDCDGMVDEDVATATDPMNCGRCGRVCRGTHGMATCVDSMCSLGDCDPGFHDINGRVDDGCEYACTPADPPVEECNLRDDDCDGTPDEGDPGGGVACGSDEGACQMGVTRCLDGRVDCEGEIRPTAELCDGDDDDCDMAIDEGNPEGGRVCGISTGVCEIGHEECMGGSLVCVDQVTGGAESCNNLDDDCDGTVDDGNPQGGAICGSDVGACVRGTMTCVRGGLSCMGGVGPRDELCNGADDNCDGMTDEDNPQGGALCGTDVGVCVPGTQVCTGGMLLCTGAVTGGAEQCNGQDDDCDGQTDEGNPQGGAACGPTAGACEAGAMACRGGTLVCEGGTGPSPEICNTVDDDCDGMADEGFSLMTDVNNCGMCGRICTLPNAFEQCVTGMCQIASCESGFFDLSPTMPGCEYACSFRGAEVCNGRDDDCDGVIDDGVVAPAGFCNPNGVCAGTGATCGATGWTCVYPTTFQSTETRCDGLDNDCDGLADEPFPLKNTACSSGAGACRRVGAFICNATQDGVTCNAPMPGVPADEACNGLDDDCDDAIDERVPDDPLTAWRDGVDLSAIATVPVTVAGGVVVRMMQYEASRPDASAGDAGDLNTIACSRPNVRPWTSVTWDQAQNACCALNETGTCPSPGGSGWRLCDAPDWEDGCQGVSGVCDWSYANACTMSQPTACNGAEHDCNGTVAGDQDCLYTTGSPSFPMCTSDWGAADLYDMSGNVREWTATGRGPNFFEVRGGSYNHIEPGRACDFDFAIAQRNDSLPNTGFRCCHY